MNCINLNLSFEDILQLLIDGQYQLDSLFHALKIEREGMMIIPNKVHQLFRCKVHQF